MYFKMYTHIVRRKFINVATNIYQMFALFICYKRAYKDALCNILKVVACFFLRFEKIFQRQRANCSKNIYRTVNIFLS